MEQRLTFGEQVKIILGRKGMTIKDLAEQIEAYTGKNMSRQNMTQRLGRDNFQEQDMRLIAEILGCKFELSIMEPIAAKETASVEAGLHVEPQVPEEDILVREVTVGELADVTEEIPVEEAPTEAPEETLKKTGFQGLKGLRKGRVVSKSEMQESVQEEQSQAKTTEEIIGDVNPYTGKEYASNSVRMHPKRIGYVQVYDQTEHKWTDMTEWAFLGFQERKKALLGKDYEPPIYLD